MILTKLTKSLEKAGVDEESARLFIGWRLFVENLNDMYLHDSDVTEIKSQLDKLEDRLSTMEVNNERRFAEIEVKLAETQSVVKLGIIILTTLSAPTFIGMLILLFNLFLNKWFYFFIFFVNPQAIFKMNFLLHDKI